MIETFEDKMLKKVKAKIIKEQAKMIDDFWKLSYTSKDTPQTFNGIFKQIKK